MVKESPSNIKHIVIWVLSFLAIVLGSILSNQWTIKAADTSDQPTTIEKGNLSFIY